MNIKYRYKVLIVRTRMFFYNIFLFLFSLALAAILDDMSRKHRRRKNYKKIVKHGFWGKTVYYIER